MTLHPGEAEAKQMNRELLRAELSELAKAIGDRQLELKFGRDTVYGVALSDVATLAKELASKTEVAVEAERRRLLAGKVKR